MSNYFWSASGDYIKKNIIEFLDNGFSATKDGLCLDNLCLTKSDIQYIKSQIEEYDIITETSKKDIINEREVKELLESIFKTMNSSSDEDIQNNYEKYFLDGIYDKRTGFVLKFQEIFTSKNLDFLELYSKVSNIKTLQIINTNKSFVNDIITTNKLTTAPSDILPNGKIINFSKDLNNFKTLSSTIVVLQFNDNTLLNLFKIDDENPNWKIYYEIPNLDIYLKTKFDEFFEKQFSNNLETIKSLNLKNEFVISEFRLLIDNYKTISIEDGKFNFTNFKGKMFIKKFSNVLNLDNLTNDYFNETIYQPNKFERIEISNDKVDELKEKMGLNDLLNIYYLLDETTGYSIRLFKIKYNEQDLAKWQILFLQNIPF